jgi:four helix bundle protein
MQQATRNTGEATQPAKGFRALRAWQAAQDLASMVYRTLKSLPPSEAWLRSQATRAAISVAANIAEGHGRGSLGDYLRFLDIARGSLAELENYLYFLSHEGLIIAEDAARLDEARIRAGNLLYGLQQATRRNSKQTWDRSDARISDDIAEYEV